MTTSALIGKAYQLVTPWDDVEEVANDNIAAGISSGLMYIAFGLVTGATIQRDDGLPLFIVYCALAAIYLFVYRLFSERFILAGSSMLEEIQRDRNYGAALTEGSTFIAAALALTSFIWVICDPSAFPGAYS